MLLSAFSTVYLQLLLTTNLSSTSFPLNYEISPGVYATSASRTALQAELDSRVPIQNNIWGLSWLPTNPT